MAGPLENQAAVSLKSLEWLLEQSKSKLQCTGTTGERLLFKSDLTSREFRTGVENYRYYEIGYFVQPGAAKYHNRPFNSDLLNFEPRLSLCYLAWSCLAARTGISIEEFVNTSMMRLGTSA